MSRSISSNSYYRASCTPRGASPPHNYRPCHLKVPQILAAASNAFSPRCLEIELPSLSTPSSHWPCSSARTSLSMGEEPLQSRRGTTDPIPSSCRSQSASPYYTKYLEGKITVMQEQHRNVVSENMNLNNQLSRAAVRNRELEEKAAALEEALLGEKRAHELPTHQRCCTLERGINTTMSEPSSSHEAATSTDKSPRRYECAVQTTLEKPQPVSVTSDDADLVSISKSELDSLESDMKMLRDAVRAKEETWDQALEREQNYRENLHRLSVELLTIRELSDSRYNELQIVVQKLTEKKEELRVIQKELALAKKTIVKLQKRQRCGEEYINNEDQPSARNAGDKLEKLQHEQQQQHHLKSDDNKPDSQIHGPPAKQRAAAKVSKDGRVNQRHTVRDYSGGGCTPRIELNSAAVAAPSPAHRTKDPGDVLKDLRI